MLLSPHHSGNYKGFGASVLGGKKQIYFSYHITTSQLCGLIGASNQRIRLGWLLGLVFPGYLLYLQGHVSYCKTIFKGLLSLPSLFCGEAVWYGERASCFCSFYSQHLL